MVGFFLADRIKTKRWYLYLLGVPLGLVAIWVTGTYYNGTRMPNGISPIYTSWYQSLMATFFIATLLGGYLFVRFVRRDRLSEDNSSMKEFAESVSTDAEWWIYFEGEVLDKSYSLEDLVDLKLFNEDLMVCRVGKEEWVEAKNDPLLEGLFDRKENESQSEKPGLKTTRNILVGCVVIQIVVVAWGGILPVGTSDSPGESPPETVRMVQSTASDTSAREFDWNKKFLCDPPLFAGEDDRKRIKAKKNVAFDFETFIEALEEKWKHQGTIKAFVEAGITKKKEKRKLHDTKFEKVSILSAIASNNGYRPIVDELLSCQTTWYSLEISPLHFSAYHGHLKMIRKLLKHGLSPNLVAKTRMTPLHYAVLGDNPKIVKILLKAGAFLDTKRYRRSVRPPVEFAEKNGSRRIIELVRQHRPDPSSEPARSGFNLESDRICDVSYYDKKTERSRDRF